MIKYHAIDGFIGLGEVVLFSHVYKFVSRDSDGNPMMIFIKMYDGPSELWSGRLDGMMTYE